MFSLKALRKHLGITLIMLAAAFAVAALDPLRHAGNNTVDVWFFDIGQGDGLMIREGNTEIVIDGGPDSTMVEKVSRVLPFWDRRLEYVINTHPHADHVNGLLALSDYYTIGQVFTAPQLYNTHQYQDFLAKVDEVDITGPRHLQITPDITLDFLAPNPKNPERQYLPDPNTGSIIVLLTTPEGKVLFTGDADMAEEKSILSQLPDIDILKVGHHGSRTATSRDLLEKSQPEVAVISCGLNNDYHHPAPETVSRLKEFGADIWQTDIDGDIRLRFEPGKPYFMRNFSL